MNEIVIKSMFGIGDLLFITPSFRVIKESYPELKIHVNTNRHSLLKNNPYVDVIGTENEGYYPYYTAPDSGRLPSEHHILEDWRLICRHFGLHTDAPILKPELYIDDLPEKRDVIGVQAKHKRLYHGKRIWHGYDELAGIKGFEPIPEITEGDKMIGLVKQIASYKAVVCNEGGISHIAAALNMPAVVLFGGFSDPLWTGYSDHINITSAIDCRHCYNNRPCERNFECWKAISVDYVKEIAMNLIRKNA